MSEKFDTILTNAGLAAVANATITQKQVNFAKLGVGDSNGAYYTPTQEATALRNQKWIGNASSVTTDPDNPNWIVVKAVIPGTVGGFEIRELGIFDENNVLLAIGKLPQTYKPTFSEGSIKELTVKTVFEVTNTSAVTLKIDPSVIYASEKYVDDKVSIVASGLENAQQQLKNHEADYVKHPGYGVTTNVAAAYAVTLNPAPTGYKDGMGLLLKLNADTPSNGFNINVNSLGAKQILTVKGFTLTSPLKKDSVVSLRYSSTAFSGIGGFILQGEGGEYGDAVASDVRKGKTVGTLSGIIPGTLDLVDLKPENLRRGVTIDGVVGVVDTTHGKIDTYNDIQNTTVRRDNGKVHRQTDDGGRVSLEVTGNDSNNTMKFQVIHRNALGIATNTVTLPEPSNKYYTYIDTVRHGFVQVARQFDKVTEYDWTTGIAVRTIFLPSSFYNPSALIAIEPYVNSNDLKLVGNKGDISGSRYGIFNTSMVMEHSMTAYYAGGYGMTRLLQKNVWLITADTWSGIVNRENNAWRETWLNSHDGSAGVVLGFAELLTNIGRKI
ncbi:phage tail protein [Lysinibacillus sphaericus]|uniref:phage tail protein n=1 Tax=Lysinibacillus sphaericus TaxID=1421 RepID=UPI00068B5F77|nr:phage tail protein [Lysinibacillus sphaericus]